MDTLLRSVFHCMVHEHDPRLVVIAGLVCLIGIFASLATAQHAAREVGASRTRWAAVAVIASGCTAWTTHFIILLAFRPGLPSAFDPLLTGLSLICAITGIAAGIFVAVGGRRKTDHFIAGVIVGTGVAALHYVGQFAYLVQGKVEWDPRLVVLSLAISLPLFGLGLLSAADRNRQIRMLALPILLLAITLLHFCGMAALRFSHDPSYSFPAGAVSPAGITPIVFAVAGALISLAVAGWRFEVEARRRLRRDRSRLRALADMALEGLIICEDDAIVTVNSTMEAMTGHDAATLTAMQASALLPGLDIANLPDREEREARLLAANGQLIPVRALRRQVELGQRVQAVIAVRDQRERLRTEAAMRALVFKDPLTGMANRTRFFELLAMHTKSKRETEQSFAVLMIDLDRFKLINDTYGHAVGDVILCEVAHRMRGALRRGDIIARLGGDEFAVLALAVENFADAEALAARIIDAVSAQPYLDAGRPLFLGASIGLKWTQDNSEKPDDLLRHADLALYAAKEEGRGRTRRFDARLEERLRESHAIEEGLRVAIAKGQLELHYQPLVDARTGRIVSAEALVRWRHPERGLIPPAEFIKIAEETGLIVPLGEWVLHTACREAASWPGQVKVAVNLSPVQFREPSLVSAVMSAMGAAKLSPERLDLEITEGVLLGDEQQTLDTLTKFSAWGVRITMDDFGTGYSSLSYLRKFPFSTVKIDRSFVQQLPHDAESVALVRAIISMTSALGMATTIEGVETAEQFRFAVAEGCTSIQGYYIGRPTDGAEFGRLVKRGAIIAA
ncbi:EAL domain-containing protein [Novosphingobium sp. BL-52-GroH]|uniref:bifunctional diguanylate cyclase/phosphodiesterase n=1 Tax=Novosphingobium sp. BL-52-GroH TaxID=3349877 RepID=UPI00384A862F